MVESLLARQNRRNSFGFRHSSFGFENPRFMESPLSLLRTHWDHEPGWSAPPVRGPAFRRSKPFQPPKGGTPYQPRFMESPDALLARIGTMNLAGARHRYGVPPAGGPSRSSRLK